MFSYQKKETEGMYSKLAQTMVEYGVSPQSTNASASLWFQKPLHKIQS